MAAEGEAPKKVILRCSDGQEFEVEVSVACEGETIKNVIEDVCADSVVPLPNVRGSTLAKVVEYWKRHHPTAASSSSSEELKQWDEEFVKMDRDEMFEVIMAANYLSAKPLLEFLCQAVADTIRNMTVEDVRDYFGIENDFTPEEEAKIRAENSWAFE